MAAVFVGVALLGGSLLMYMEYKRQKTFDVTVEADSKQLNSNLVDPHVGREKGFTLPARANTRPEEPLSSRIESVGPVFKAEMGRLARYAYLKGRSQPIIQYVALPRDSDSF